MEPSLSEEALPSKTTVRGKNPLVGVALTEAVGGLFNRPTVMRTLLEPLAPSSSVTVRVTV
jgi:hypothetical protein